MNAIINTAVTMTSLEIAELVDSRHDKVKQSIERLASRAIIELPPLGEIPTATKPTSVYRFAGEQGKRDSIIVVAQLSPEFTARLVDRWQELESQTSKPTELSRLEILQLALESEQGRIKAETERDEAVRTKAQIGSRREAQAMAKASSAVRQVKRLENELGRGAEQATITAVENAIGERFPRNAYVELRRWCKDNGTSAVEVPDDRYGVVKAWPAAAWLAVHGIDLGALFGMKQTA